MIEEKKFSALYIEVKPANTPEAQFLSLDKALKIFKRKVEKEGIIRLLKQKKYYIKPSQLEHDRIRKIERRRELRKRKKNK